MRFCSHCATPLRPVRMQCPRCTLTHEGPMRTSRLNRLSRENADIAERLILAAGNLTVVAGQIGVSHPTARKRVDSLIAELTELREQDQAEADRILRDVEEGRLNPEEGARLIGEMSGAV